MAKDLLFPVFEEMDRIPPKLESGEVTVHPAMRDIIDQFAQGG